MALTSIGSRVATALETISDAFGGTGFIELPLGGAWRADTGVILAVFADAAAGGGAPPGTQLTNSKALTVRWNNDSAFVAIGWSVVLPADWDNSVNATIHYLVSKTGATDADDLIITTAAYNQALSALHDADTDFGGDSTAMVGTTTAKTVVHLTRTLATADLTTYPGSMTITAVPKAGTLATDDAVLHGAWITYSRQNPA